jgi:hypothetical protein
MAFLNPCPGFFQHAADALAGWFDEQFLSVFAHILAEEVEASSWRDGDFLGERSRSSNG